MTDGYQEWKGEIKLSAVNDHEKIGEQLQALK